MIIGLSGYARSGKDEAAKVLVEEFGFTQVAFADKLRDMLYALNPMCGRGSDYSDHPVVYLQDVIDEYGWGGYKESEYGIEIRRLLQRLGTEAGRQTLSDTIWIDSALTGFGKNDKVVVTDCRFPNEASAIVERGGKIWRVERSGVGPAVGKDGTIHRSEISLDDWRFDYTIWNHSSLEHYRQSIVDTYKMYQDDLEAWSDCMERFGQ